MDPSTAIGSVFAAFGLSGAAGLNAWLPVFAGALLAGSVHRGRAMLRPVSTAGTAGVANPFLSLAEDATSGVLTAVAFVLPVLAFLLVAGIFVALAAGRRRLAGRRRPPNVPQPAPGRGRS